MITVYKHVGQHYGTTDIDNQKQHVTCRRGEVGLLPGASDATHFIRSTVDFCQLAVIELDCHCAREPPPRPTPQAHVSRDSNVDFNPDPIPDVCRIDPIMYWIHSLVSIRHFAMYRKIGQ